MTGTPVSLLLVDGHNLLFRACFGTPAQHWSPLTRTGTC
jgi:hypothetical protein